MFCGMIVMMFAFIVAAIVQGAIQVEYYLFIDKFNSLKIHFSQEQMQFQFVLIQIYLMDIIVQ
jgi:hypothetical protein